MTPRRGWPLSLVLVLACTDPRKEPPRPDVAAPPPATPTSAAPAPSHAEASATVPTADLEAPADVGQPPADARRTASGFASKVLREGTGKDRPGELDRVKIHYTGWTRDRRMFDSSLTRGKPSEFRLDQVIKGWTEGLQLMVEGEKRRLWVPAAMAYGDKPRIAGTPAGDLTFDVELLSVTRSPRAPEDVKTPPATSKKTASNLAYRILKPGTGTRHPGPTDRVTVHYTGWTPEGKTFETSVTGDPGSFDLAHVIKGWTEGLQLMVEGEKTRFWIPGDLAYGERPRRTGVASAPPSGALVFDIELLSIK